MTFASSILSPFTHKLPPKTIVWRDVTIHKLDLPLVTYVSHIALPNRPWLLRATFVSCVATLLMLFLPLGPSAHHAKTTSIVQHKT
jgi:hypothetical protein